MNQGYDIGNEEAARDEHYFYEEDLKQRVRDDAPLIERLKVAKRMIGDMCSEHRCPKMSIPVAWYDEDFFITTTIDDALEQLQAPSPTGGDECEEGRCHRFDTRTSERTCPRGRCQA